MRFRAPSLERRILSDLTDRPEAVRASRRHRRLRHRATSLLSAARSPGPSRRNNRRRRIATKRTVPRRGAWTRRVHGPSGHAHDGQDPAARAAFMRAGLTRTARAAGTAPAKFMPTIPRDADVRELPGRAACCAIWSGRWGRAETPSCHVRRRGATCLLRDATRSPDLQVADAHARGDAPTLPHARTSSAG